MIEIKILLENTKPNNSAFEVEHGLSLYITTSQSTFIFDCGDTGIAWNNAALMNVDLSKVQFVMLSHSHYDHAAGFPKLLNYSKPKFLYTGKDFWLEKFSLDEDTNEYKYAGCGFTKDDLDRWQIEQRICEDVLKIDDETFLISSFNKKYNFETIPKKFVIGEDRISDPFNDEIVLVLREDDGLAIVTGCAHNGILNIVSTVQEKFNQPIKTVIGGIHLWTASDDRINKTFNELKNFGVKNLALGHCSGDKVIKNAELRMQNVEFSTGKIILI